MRGTGAADRPMRRRTRATAVVIGLASSLLVAACTAPPLVPFPDVDPPSDELPVAAVAGRLEMADGQLVDSFGRVVLLRGINSVQKSTPFISTEDAGWLGPAELEYFRRSGFNAVRLGVTFAALMPTPGVVDGAYLDDVVEATELLAANGLWVQLDFHQDVFHQMPDWATPPDAAGLSEETPPLFSFIGWAGAYLSPKSIRQWDSFLAGEPHVGGRSVAAVLGDAAGALAAAVIDIDAVVGMELLNEPFSGSAVVRCIVDGCPDREQLLSDRYSEMAAPIRAAAPEMAIWIEPFAPTAYLAQPTLPRPAVTPTASGDQIGLAWHLYCHDTDGGEVEIVDAATAGFCRARFDNGFTAGRTLADRLDGARILNEFGASNNPLDAAIVTEMADAEFVSWMYWHGPTATSPTDSTIPDEVEAHLIRPFPQATAGTPRALSYEPSTRAFSFRYLPDATIDAPTEIIVPVRAYPTGHTVTVTNGTVTSPDGADHLTVVPIDSTAAVTVAIARV